MKPHFGQSDEVMNKLAGYTKEEHEEAAGMPLEPAFMNQPVDLYRKFVQGYIKLCEETGLFMALTTGAEMGVFELDKFDNREDFAKQIEELNTI